MAGRERLLGLVEIAEQRGQAQLDKQLGAIAKALRAALREPWDDFDKHTLTEPADAAGDAALWLDAAQAADRYMLADKRAKIIEVALSGEAREDRRRYLESCNGALGAGTGFVVLAYEVSKQRTAYTYVGLGKGPAGVTFSGTSRLARALANSSHLMLLLPRRSNQAVLRELHSAIYLLVRCVSGKEPEFNKAFDPELPESEAWQRVEALSDLLEQAGVHLFNRAKLHQD